MDGYGEREKVRFVIGGTECAAWHYPGTNGACVIMAGGFAVTKEPGTDQFAKRFQEAGFSVLAFDYRHLGESGGQPRQVVRVREQLEDWRAAISFAAGLAEVDPARLAIWAFSASGGYVFPLAARDPRLAAAIAQTPNADNPAAARNAARHQKPLAMLRFTGLAVLDALGSLAGRPPRLVPLGGPPGTVALLTTPDAADSGAALNPGGRYPDWRQEVAARSALRLTVGRPGRWPRGYGARCWSWCATRTSPRWPSPRSARRGGRPGPSSSGCPAGTTRPSWTRTSRPSRPRCPSCAGT